MSQPRFVTGSLLRHITTMAGTGAIGLVAIFAVDLINLLYISRLGESAIAAAVGFAGVVGFFHLSLFIGLLIGIAAMIRWLGAVRWRRLHQSVYAIALLALLHFYWMRASKNNVQEVWWYGVWIAGLLLWRIGRFFNTSGNVNTTTQPHKE